jgi:uncharacterized membrane protein YbhN (UPF0104 family)
VAGLLVGGACLWLSLSGVDLQRVAEELARIAWPWAGVSVVGVILVSAGKALRWQWLYPLGSQPLSWRTHFSVLLVAQMLNLVVPVRLGEVARLGLMRQEHRPVGTTLGTIAVEKSPDLTASGALLIAVVPAVLLPGWLRSAAGLGLFLIGLGLLMALCVVGGHRKRIVRWMTALRPRSAAWARWSDRLLGLADTMLQGLGGLGGRRLVGVVILTGLIWLTSVAVMRAMLMAFRVQGGWTAALVLVLAIAFSNLAPTPPALVGLIGAVTEEALAPFGVARPQALALGTMLNLVLVGPPVVLGGWVVGVRLMRLAASRAPRRLQRALGLDAMDSVGAYSIGTYPLGSVRLVASADGQSVQNSPLTIPVTLLVVEKIHRAYLPIAARWTGHRPSARRARTPRARLRVGLFR